MNNDNSQPLRRFLALDTSTACLALAVMENERVLHTIKASGERNHSVHLLPLIQKGLKEAGVNPSDLHGVAVGVGPGSYTGTRIAITAAKTLAWAWDIPVVGISSLQALAWSGLGESPRVQESRGISWVIPLIDARRAQAYTALFVAEGSAMPIRKKEDAIRLMQNWVDELEQLLQETSAEDWPDSVWFVGEIQNLTEAAERLRSLLGDKLHLAACDMEGQPVGQLGAYRLLRGEQDDLHSLVPNYTQLAEAEKLLRKP